MLNGPPTLRRNITSLPTSAFSWRVVIDGFFTRLNLLWFTMVLRVTEQTVVQELVEASSPPIYLQHYDTFAVLNVLMILFYSILFYYYISCCMLQWSGRVISHFNWSEVWKKMLHLQWCHRTGETPAGENKTLTLAPPMKVSKVKLQLIKVI